MTDKEALNKSAVYLSALDTFGAENQTRMMFEEMAELQKELCKNARGWLNRQAIAEEIADVEIMLEQMKLLHGCAADVLQFKQEKLDRLQARIQSLKSFNQKNRKEK